MATTYFKHRAYINNNSYSGYIFQNGSWKRMVNYINIPSKPLGLSDGLDLITSDGEEFLVYSRSTDSLPKEN